MTFPYAVVPWHNLWTVQEYAPIHRLRVSKRILLHADGVLPFLGGLDE